MKVYRNCFVCILLAMSVALCQGQDDFETNLIQANELMASENFEQAIPLYESLHEADYRSPGLYFNLGSAYYHKGQIAKSILNLERAHKLAPRNKDILKALSMAKEKIDDAVIPVEPFFVTASFGQMRDLISAGAWALLTLVFLWFLAIFIYGEIKDRHWISDQYRLVILVSVGLLFTASLIFAIARYQFEGDTSLAIMMTPDAGLYLAPDTSSDLLQRVESGEKVRIMNKLGDWVEIELENRDRGWTQLDGLERI